MHDELIRALGTASRIAFTMITSPGYAALQASLDRAYALPAGCRWERRAAAHAEFFTTLADVAGDLCATAALNCGAEFSYDLMMRAGRLADGLVINSRRRTLAHLRAGDTEEAALELERHLRILSFVGRLAASPARRVRPLHGSARLPRNGAYVPSSFEWSPLTGRRSR